MEEKKKTRIASLHADNAKAVVGEKVTISGYLQWYNERERRWEPLRGWLKVYVDGVEVGKTASRPNGSFEFKYTSSVTGRRSVEVRFPGDPRHKPCKREIKIEFLSQEQKKRIDRMIKIAFALISALILIVILITVMLWRI